MAEQFGRGGGMPDLSSMMVRARPRNSFLFSLIPRKNQRRYSRAQNNPQLRAMAEQFGRGRGSGGADGGNSDMYS